MFRMLAACAAVLTFGAVAAAAANASLFLAVAAAMQAVRA